jgi:2-polyprenyl-6-methoxyphenol hydroxylase-like FAD-dependent oxidoreductase
MAHLGKHAIVVGASIAGLLAARALADRYDEVTLLERDALPDGCDPRKGVPQGRHTHGLLARGREALEELFPGLTEELAAQGAVAGDGVNEILWFNHGCYLHNAPSKMIGVGMSRPLLEACVRRRLLQLPNVRLRERCEALEPMFEASQGRVTGLRIQTHGRPDSAESLSADLVVDAGGRGSRIATWLNLLGYDKPREERIQIDIGYVTRQFTRRPTATGGKNAVVMAACRPDWRFGALLAIEGERWTVTMGGYLGDEAPDDDASFLEFARNLPKPEIYDVIKRAEPVSPIEHYKFAANLRRRYDELTRFPEGLLICGDAFCSFNPVYAQGMTVACLEALALRDCLAGGADGLARRFFRAASRIIDIPWQIAVGSDLQHPRVQGKRTAQVRFVNWYIEKLYRAAQHDEVLTLRFLEVANLTRQPSSLFDPRIAWRVWSASRAPAQPAVQLVR